MTDAHEAPGDVGRALARLNTELTASNRAVAAATGLNESDLAVLDLLHQDGPAAPAALARATRIPPATMTNVLARLERDGWVERRPDAADRRSARIHPTGTARLAQLYAPANAELGAALAALPPEHGQAVITFLGEAARIVHERAAALAARETPGGTS